MSAADLERLVLQRARNGLRPSAAQRKATLSRLTAAVSIGPLPGASDMPKEPSAAWKTNLHPSQQVARSSVRSFSQSMMVTGILTGALVGFGAGYLVSAGRTSDTQQDIASGGPLVQRPQSQLADTAASVSATPPKPETIPSAKTASIRPEARPGPTSPSQPAGVRKQSSGIRGASEPTFYEELAYVRRAQSALQRGDGTLALGLMQSLDEIKPGGALLAERHVTRILALCQLGRTEEAIAVAKRALSRDTTTHIYQRRLALSCARDALSEADE